MIRMSLLYPSTCAVITETAEVIGGGIHKDSIPRHGCPSWLKLDYGDDNAVFVGHRSGDPNGNIARSKLTREPGGDKSILGYGTASD